MSMSKTLLSGRAQLIRAGRCGCSSAGSRGFSTVPGSSAPAERCGYPVVPGAARRLPGIPLGAAAAHVLRPVFVNDSATNPPHDRAHATLQRVFGYAQFRGPQEAIVDHVTAGGDALVLMPTGGGKSLCYQIPAAIRRCCPAWLSCRSCCGNLVTQALASASGHQHQRIAAGRHVVDDRLLRPTKLRVTEYALQRRMGAVMRRICSGVVHEYGPQVRARRPPRAECREAGVPRRERQDNRSAQPARCCRARWRNPVNPLTNTHSDLRV